MEKQKRWQLYVIIAVILLTIYNILPTVFYYTKPLRQPIEEKQATQVAQQITSRVNTLETDAVSWIKAFSKNLGIKPSKVEFLPSDSRYIEVSFKDPKEAALFSRILPRAGTLIPFVPSQLELGVATINEPNKVIVQRLLGTHFPENSNQFFTFSQKSSGDQQTFYQTLVLDRAATLIEGIAGESDTARLLSRVLANPSDPLSENILISLSRKIVDFDKTFGSRSSVARRFWASFTQTDNPGKTIENFSSELDAFSKKLTSRKNAILQAQKELKDKGEFLNSAEEQQLKLIKSDQISVDLARAIVAQNTAMFKAGKPPLSFDGILKILQQGAVTSNQSSKVQIFEIKDLNPFISSVAIDWANNEVKLALHSDVQTVLNENNTTEAEVYRAEKANQLLIDQIAALSSETNEQITPSGPSSFTIALNQLADSQSILALNLGKVAEAQAVALKSTIQSVWRPENADFSSQSFPVWDYTTYKSLPADQKKLGLVIYAPSAENELPSHGFKTSSIYVIAKGLDALIQQYSQSPNSPQARSFKDDLDSLRQLLQQEGFFGYAASAYDFPKEFHQDYIFEQNDYYGTLLQATRENFSVHGSRKFAVLEFSDVEQRILTLNKIEDSIHEDLLKWKDAYSASQVDLNLSARYDVPPPVKNVYWDNLQLSTKKYFRGDNQKVLHWGLDLSGGKTVRIGLRDKNNRQVTNPDDLREGVNELYKRVNKMGVSEVGIRVEGDNIVLDFPGSQGLSASELVKASAMTFHVVNEKFTPNNTALATTVNQFLQEVWNDAVVTNRKDMESVNLIAWQHLGGVSEVPQSEAARILVENGLQLSNPREPGRSSAFDDSISSIAILRGDSFTEWEGQSHPLLIVFNNYALEGSWLENVQIGYDPSKGNMLSFGVSSSASGPGGQKIDPRDDFFAWTSQYAEEKIAGTPKELFSKGRGWRMAVILNGSVISSPSLTSPLRDQAMISGRFSQREINQLAADLKAGSLSFTPQILAEQNISPELGKEERFKGITAAFVGALLVVIAMILYYRFAGVVASVAVLFNLLIMWGVLQNLDAALTLPGIAGIILTIGMAVDANVLVYERIREEFALSKRLPSAVQAGYRKAFSAIFDSNITTIIAAVILLQFDSGPIKGFAVTLIIGIISSMFTALFMTRYFFAGWVQNPKNKTLKMSHWIGKTSFDFLSKAKTMVVLSLIVTVVGGYLLIAERNTILGMDFTGGYALAVDIEEKPDTDYRLEATKALGLAAPQGDFQVRELNSPHNLRIQLGMSIEQPGHPFYGMPLHSLEGDTTYSYEQNPRILWLVNTLKASGMNVNPNQLPTLEQNWSEMSGQLSDTMRNSAIVGMAVALFCILIYLTIRFEFNYALSAIIGLAHDVLITLAILGLFHALGMPVQIDLQVIAALVTIIGYSLNDTIIIFDRIREDVRLMRKVKYSDIINHALNATLSRTLMTSGTTLIVLLALVILGGSTIFDFALVMTVGVVIGTLSSLFITAPLMLYFHHKDASKQEKANKAPIARIRASNTQS